MKIKVDIYLRSKEKGNVVDIKNVTLDKHDILSAAVNKYKNDFSLDDRFTLDPQIDETII